MRTKLRTPTLLHALLAAMLLVACGGGDRGDDASAIDPPSQGGAGGAGAGGADDGGSGEGGSGEGGAGEGGSADGGAGGAGTSDPPPRNAAPVASLQAPHAAEAGSSLRLDAGGSRDPDGDELRYTWTVLERPPGSRASLQAETSARASFVPDVAGAYVVRVEVDDGRASATAEAAIDAWRQTPFEAFFVGDGEIPDVRGGGTLRLPIERRVHVALLPEGYRQADLDAGAFDRDAQRWWDELVAVEPYATFREALVVWKLPAASSARVSASAPQSSDTAFRVPVTSDGGGVDGSVGADTASRVWSAIGQLPYPPSRFFPSGGRTSRIAKDVVVHLLVLDPRTGRTGLSGRTVTLADPRDAGRRVAVALAHDLPHEFSHAFSRLRDEYVEDCCGAIGADNRVTDESANVTNVVIDPSCDALPWKHLLPGGGISDTNGLVGAYGIASVGYHPELKCLMNGKHDNAAYYGGDGWLRTPARLCNFCREVTAFRFLERTGVLDDPSSSWSEWKARHRARFYERFGFSVPAVVPQRTSDGRAWDQACAD